MLNLNKRFLETQDHDAPHIGALLKTQFTASGIKKAAVQRALGVSDTSLYRYFQQKSIQVTILWRISKILKVNFLMALGEQLQIPYETQKEKELQQQLAQQCQLIKELGGKLDYLESILKR